MTRTPGHRRADQRQRLEPVHARHREVEHHQVGLQLGGQLDRSQPVGGLADDREPVARLHAGPQQHPEVFGVVDDEDPVRVFLVDGLLQV